MPLSMKPDSMMNLPGEDQEQQIFEQSFTDMAQAMLMRKHPELADQVVTFKIVDSDIETGSAVGAFILDRPSGLVYIPCVLSENQVKPLEVMYAKSRDAFLPLTEEWITEVERSGVPQMGEGVKTPESLYSDVDIRNLVVPPMTGRYSYASDKSLILPDFLSKADNSTRAKCAALLTQDPGLMKVAVAIYGAKVIAEALRPRAEKVAEAPASAPGLVFVDSKAPKSKFNDLFGSEAPAAMRGVAVKGYYAMDSRKDLKRPVDEESRVVLTEIRDSGAYKIFKAGGDAVKAMVFVRPHNLRASNDYDKYTGPQRTHENIRELEPNFTSPPYTQVPDPGYVGYRYLVVLNDGTYAQLNKAPCGEAIDPSELEGAAAQVYSGKKSEPKQGKGIFVRNRGGHRPEATIVLDVNSVATGSDGVKRVKGSADYRDVTVIIDAKHPHGRIMAPKGDAIAVVPDDYSFVPVGDRLWDDDFIDDPRHVASAYLTKLREAGAVPLKLKKEAAEGIYSIGGTSYWGDKPTTVYVVAKAAHISVPDAEEIIKKADENGSCRVLVCTKKQLQKLAAAQAGQPQVPYRTTTVKEPADMAQQGPPPGAEQGQPMPVDPAAMQDPSMQGQDPAMAQGEMPPPPPEAQPSLTDQAVQELQEEVARAHEEQMKLLQHKLDALSMVSQRTQELAAGVPRSESQAIQAAVTNAGVMTTPGTQNAEPGPAGEAAPGELPDPGLMQQAAGLADPEMFDSAAVGTLAEHGSVKDLVASYLPTLEKTIDHLGRILLTMWIKGSELRIQLGDQNYTELEDKVRNMFRGLGEVVLKLNQGSSILGEGMDLTDEHHLGN